MAGKNMNTISINSEKDFIDFLSKIDDKDFLTTTVITASQIEVAFKINGGNFSSSLTGSLIQALANYQEKIYHIYKIQRYGEGSRNALTDEEKRALEIRVDIKPGCTEAIISFVKDIIPEVVNKMTGAEISHTAIAITGIVISAWAIKGIVVPTIQEAFKMKRAEIKAKIEKEGDETKRQFLSTIQNVTQDAINGMRSVAQGFIIANPDSLSVDGKEISNNILAEIPRDMRNPRSYSKDDTPRYYTVEGKFKVLELNYEKAVTIMKAQHIESGEFYDDISLQNDWMKPETMALLENAQAREPVIFRIICQKDGRRTMHIIDVNSVRKIEETNDDA